MQQGSRNGICRIRRIRMKLKSGIFTGLVVLGLLCISGIATAQDTALDTSGTVLTDDIQPYNGPIGADSPLYGLKIALEDMDESFTANETERVDKEMDHARLRLSEVRRSLELNQSESTRQALNNYWLKMNLTNSTISQWRSNATGLLHAQEMIVKHQFVLEHLLESHPNNTGLQRAYNNSLDLEERFSEKTAIRFNRTIAKNNQTILKAIHLEQKAQERHGKPSDTIEPNETRTQPAFNETLEKLNGQDRNKDKHEIPVTNMTLTRPSPEVTPSRTQDNQPEGNQQHGNADNNGKGNPHNK
jgi:hypothetical protein